MTFDNAFFLGTLFLYFAALASYAGFLFSNRVVLNRWAVRALMLGFGFHTVSLIRQVFELFQSSAMNLFAVLILFSWSLVLLTLLIQSRVRMRMVMGIVLVLVLALGGIFFGLPRYFDKAIPSFNAFWFGTHVLFSLLGYAAFALSLICGLLYLFLERQLKLKSTNSFFYRLPPLESLELMAFRSLWGGTLLLGLGLASGLLWARWAGLPLSFRDPKVSAAIITWLIYAVILYVRFTARWRGRKVAYLSLVGFLAVLITFFVMNYFSKGHGFF
ncbi:MAG: cytochrome c biogenesis protein CcsA [Chlamydiae bacterium]|nr:cytochrome c biogenesis protein CcsA [Chlamydiota bacterium]MBI3266351.1 cytochrome c biogenesis protein CcsA [Chlamydiota bacterium]